MTSPTIAIFSELLIEHPDAVEDGLVDLLQLRPAEHIISLNILQAIVGMEEPPDFDQLI